MNPSCPLSQLRIDGKSLASRSWLIAIVALALFVSPARANLLLNGGFDTAGPAGSAVSTTGQGSGPSAAADWTQFAIVPGSHLRTELLPTTDPSGSGSMIHVFTDNGYWSPALFGNGFSQAFNPVNAAVLTYDLFVVSGKVTGGLVLASDGAYADFPTFGPTGGWIHVTDKWTKPVDAVAFETLTLNAGAEYYVDNVVLTTAVPEPTSLVLAGIAALIGVARVNARRRCTLGQANPG